MRIFLLYLAFLGSWIISSWCHHVYDEAVVYTVANQLTIPQSSEYIASKTYIWIEAARVMIFTSIAIFSFLSFDNKPKSLSFKVQLQHVFVIVCAKMIEHWFGFAGVLGLETPVSPYHFNFANYILGVGYFIITPIRIMILKRRKAFESNEYNWL